MLLPDLLLFVAMVAADAAPAPVMPPVGPPPVLMDAPAPEAQAGEGSDLLLPGDLVSVEVYGQNDLTTSVRIPARGPVTFPLVGPVEGIQGLSTEAVSRKLQELYERDFLQRAVVTVTLRDRSRRRAFVMGSVARPSAIELPPSQGTTALRAISECGGFLEEADRNLVQVVREDPASGAVRMILVRVGTIDQPGSLTASAAPSGSVSGVAIPADGTIPADLALLPNDLVIVPRMDRVYLLGQVNRPGAVSLPSEGLALSKAMSLAAGFDRFAREDEVQLLRAGEPVRTIDVGGILAGKTGIEDPLLRPGDTVYVPARRF